MLAVPAIPPTLPTTATLERSNGRSGVIVTVLALAGMMAALQQTLVVPLIPDLPEILGVSPTTASWAVTITILSSAVATPIVSRLADMVGKRRMVVVALVLMTTGSVLVAVGGTFATAIAGRCLQGLAGSLIPVGISIMRDALPRERVGFAIALMSATLGIGTALGLPLSGVLYGTFGFASIFWVAAAGGVLLTIAVMAFVPESTVRTPARFDYVGAVLVCVALATALLAVSKAGDWGWESGEVIGLLLASCLALLVWFPYELRVNDPLVNLRTAGRRPVLLTNIASVFVAFGLFVNILASGQQLQMRGASGFGFGFSVTDAGLAMMPAGVAMALLAPISGRMLHRLGGRITLIVGAGVMCAAYTFRVFATASVAEVVIGSTLVGIGAALAFAAMPTLILANVPVTETAAANGLNALMRALGAATASAVLAAILASFSVTTAGRTFPSLAAFVDIYWISAATAMVAVVMVALIPTRRRGTAPASAVAGAGAETVVHGRIRPRRPGSRVDAIVTVTRLDGDSVDWARTDRDGRFSVALPGFDRYLLVANARGWAPSAEVVDFHPGAAELDMELTEELALTGSVTSGRQTVPHTLVTLHGAGGEFVATAETDDDGRFTMPLPTAGPYVVTAMHPQGERASAKKVVVNALAAHVDIEV
jgi:MFS family permease